MRPTVSFQAQIWSPLFAIGVRCKCYPRGRRSTMFPCYCFIFQLLHLVIFRLLHIFKALNYASVSFWMLMIPMCWRPTLAFLSESPYSAGEVCPCDELLQRSQRTTCNWFFMSILQAGAIQNICACNHVLPFYIHGISKWSVVEFSQCFSVASIGGLWLTAIQNVEKNHRTLYGHFRLQWQGISRGTLSFPNSQKKNCGLSETTGYLFVQAAVS